MLYCSNRRKLRSACSLTEVVKEWEVCMCFQVQALMRINKFYIKKKTKRSYEVSSILTPESEEIDLRRLLEVVCKGLNNLTLICEGQIGREKKKQYHSVLYLNAAFSYINNK